MKKSTLLSVIAAIAALPSALQAAPLLVTIGNLGNAAQSAATRAAGNTNAGGDGFGAVGYGYGISKYEVSNADWFAVYGAGDNNALPKVSVSLLSAMDYVNKLTEAANGNSSAFNMYTISGSTFSLNYATRADAVAANKLIYAIPTRDEWFKAAFYNPADSRYYQYPTMSNAAPVTTLGGTTAGTAVYKDGTTTPTSFTDVNLAGGESWYGTVGQGGNVQEWMQDTSSATNAYRLGGRFSSLAGDLRSSNIASNSNFSSSVFGDIGFRIVAIPEPSSVGLLLGSGLVALVLLRRRHKK